MIHPSALWHYYWARLKVQPLQELLALTGIATGVALIFAVLVANSSVIGSVERLTSGVAGNASVQLSARDPDGVDERLVEQVRAVSGVRTAAAMLEQRVDIRGPDGTRTGNLVGVTPELAELDGPLARSIGDGAILLDSFVIAAPLAHALGIRAADRAVVESRGRARPVRVSALLGGEQVGEFVKSPLVVTALPYAQRVTGLSGRVTRVLVAAAPGREHAVRAALARRFGDEVNVGDVYTEARLLRQAAEPLEQSAAVFAAISAFVGLLFAFNAMLLTVPARRRFIAELRMQGFGGGQIALHVMFEALVLGVAASAVGLAVGDQLSRHLFEPIPGYLTFAFPVGAERSVPPEAIAFACAAGVVASLVAGARPLGDVLSSAPIDTAYRTSGEPIEGPAQRGAAVAFAVGVALLVATAVAVRLEPSLTIAGAALLIIALVLVLPLMLRPAIALATALSRHPRGGLAMIAASELRATPTRSVALAATAAVAVFGIVAIEGARRDLIRGLDKASHGLTSTADVWVTARGRANTLTTVPLSTRALATRLAGKPGIADVRRYHASFLDVRGRRLWIIGRPLGDRFQIPPGQVIDGDPTLAETRIRRGGWVALTDAVADEHGAELGEPIRLDTPSGPRDYRLAARLTNVGWASGTAIISAEEYRRAWNSPEPSALEVTLDDGVAPQAGKRLVSSALGTGAALRVDTGTERWALLRADARSGLRRLDQIATLALVSAALALAAAIGLALWQRRSRLAALRLQGFSARQLTIALAIETALLLALGALAGAVFGLYGQALATRWLELTTGFPTVYRPADVLAGSTVAAVLLVALVVAAVPGSVAASAPLKLAFRGD